MAKINQHAEYDAFPTKLDAHRNQFMHTTYL